ncbi:hypothetical protein [Streptomyces sp. NPDC046197]
MYRNQRDDTAILRNDHGRPVDDGSWGRDHRDHRDHRGGARC